MKPNLILLAGHSICPDEIDRVADRFRHEFRVLTFPIKIDVAIETDEHFRAQTEALDEFVVDNHLEEFSLFGYGIGGYVALKYALVFTNKIDQIYNFGSRFSWFSNSEETELKKMNPKDIHLHVPAFADFLMYFGGVQNWRSALTDTKELLRIIGARENCMEKGASTIACLITQSYKIERQPQVQTVQENNEIGAYTAQQLHQNRLRVLKQEKVPVYSQHQQELDEIFYNGPTFEQW